jgi:hypothetical protein
MATDVGRVSSTAASKYDVFVAAQLGRAEARIRLLDLTAALLGFAALVLAYIVGMVLCDSKLELTPNTRQWSLYLFLAASALYLLVAVVRPLRLRVNPYYAARQVERQLPGAKNSIVNWVDLHTQPLPPAIRGALGQRAAKDLSQVDLDSVISGRRAAWAGGLAGLCALAFIVAFFMLGPSPFYSLLQRAFNPFGQRDVATRTQLTILKPAGGDAVVTVGRGVHFVVEVTGKVPDLKAPDAVKLQYRYEEGDPWLERLLLPETGHEWTASLSALEVKNGFWYRITGGDAMTDEHRVSVRAAPAVTDFLATYHYRPYVARADEVRRERPLKALRGTEARLRVRTNRTLRDGWLEFTGETGAKTERGVVDPADSHTLLVFFHLDEDGRYRLHFTSTDGEAYSDPAPYAVTAIPDLPPTVELTKPGQDIRLPADGLLQLEGKAGDDIGVKKLELQMEVVGGERLRGQLYRGEDALRLADGGYPREVEYKDFVELSRVKNQQGKPVALRAGMELEYWLEAYDACDYPHAHFTGSKHYRVLLTEPEKNEAKRQQEKKQSEQDKKKHQQKQDEQLKQESQERRQERQEQEARNKEEQDKSNPADKGAGDAPQKNEGDKAAGQEDKGAQGDPNNGQGESKNDLPKDQQDVENRIKDALERQQGENGAGESKPDKGEQGEAKGGPQNNPEGGNQAGEKSEGEGKDAGQQGANQAGEGKDKGQPQPGGDPAQGDGKGDKASNPMSGDKGETKGDNPMSQPGAGQPSEGKDNGKPDATQQPGEGKSGGPPQMKKDAGEGKPQPGGQGQDSSATGDSKPADARSQQAKGEGLSEAKDRAGSSGHSEPKETGDKKDDARAEGKQAGSSPKDDPSASGDAKPAGSKGEGDSTTQGDAKPDAGEQARNATPKDAADLAKDLESGDPKKREEAKKQLERIQKEARDPQAREKADEALNKAGQPDGPGDDSKPQPGNGSSGQSSDGSQGSKGSKGDKGDGSKGSGSSGSGKGEKGEGDEGSSGKGEKNGQGSSSGSTTAKEATNREGGNTPGGGGNRRSGDNSAGGSTGGSGPEAKPSKPRDHRAAQMQLDDFLKKVNKDILKDAGVSEEAWKKYLEAKRKQVTPPDKPGPDSPADPQQAPQLPSMGGRTISSSSSTNPGDAHGPDRGQPPPGYRDRFREFSRQMSNKGK